MRYTATTVSGKTIMFDLGHIFELEKKQGYIVPCFYSGGGFVCFVFNTKGVTQASMYRDSAFPNVGERTDMKTILSNINGKLSLQETCDKLNLPKLETIFPKENRVPIDTDNDTIEIDVEKLIANYNRAILLLGYYDQLIDQFFDESEPAIEEDYEKFGKEFINRYINDYITGSRPDSRTIKQPVRPGRRTADSSGARKQQEFVGTIAQEAVTPITLDESEEY